MTVSIPVQEQIVVSTNVTDDTPEFNNTVKQNFPENTEVQYNNNIYYAPSLISVVTYDSLGTYDVGAIAYKDGYIQKMQPNQSGEVPKQPEIYASSDTSMNHTGWVNRYVKLADTWANYPNEPFSSSITVGSDTITNKIEKNMSGVWEHIVEAEVVNTGSILNTGTLTPNNALSVDATGNASWNVPANIATEDGAASYVSVEYSDSRASSDWLVGLFDFSSIPDTANIIGIEFGFKRREGVGDSTFHNSLTTYAIQVYNNGSFVGNNKATGTLWGNNTTAASALTFEYAGASNDTWGLTLTGADLKNNFGVGVKARFKSDLATRTAYVDVMTMKVYYQPTSSTTVISTSTTNVIKEILSTTLEANATITTSSVYPEYAHALKTIIVRDDGIYARTNQTVSQEYVEVTGNFFAIVEEPTELDFVFKKKNNIYRPFDSTNYSYASQDGNIQYRMRCDDGFNALALGKVLCTGVTVTFRDELNNVLKTITKTVDCSILSGRIYAPKTIPFYCPTTAKIVDILITGETTQVGTIQLADSITQGFTNMEMEHSIKDWSTFEQDEFGNASYIERPTSISYSGTVDIVIVDYDETLRLVQYLNKKDVIIDGSDSNNIDPDGNYIFASTCFLGRILTFKQNTRVKNNDIDKIATCSFNIEEIV